MIRVSFENCINKINISHKEKSTVDESLSSNPSSNDSLVVKQLLLLLKRLDSSIINENTYEALDVIHQLQVGNNTVSHYIDSSNYC